MNKLNCYCPKCQALVDMAIVGKTFPWGCEYVCCCLGCQSRFVVDLDNQTVAWLLDPTSSGKERASYNRKLVGGHWFIEGYLAVEQGLEEHPSEDSPSKNSLPKGSQRLGDSYLECFLERGRGGNSSGVSHPEGRG